MTLSLEPPNPAVDSPWPARLLVNGIAVGRVADAQHLPPLIEGLSIGLAVRTRRDAVPLHAAAVADAAGRVLILPGTKGSGKSTLSALLAGRSFSYLTDELVFVATADDLVHPFPKAATLKAGSFPLFDTQQTWSDAVRGPIRYADPPRPELPPRPATALVFPRHDPAARAPELQPLSPGEALMRLIRSAFGGLERHRRTPDTLARLARLPAAALHFASVEGVAEQLSPWLEVAASAPKPAVTDP